MVARLKRDMVSFATDFTEVTPEGYVEGPFMFKRRGTYYFMWSEGIWGNATYCAAYARSSSPFGPFTRAGTMLSNDARVATSAGHHSVITLPGMDEHYICYHRRPLDQTDKNHRVVCIDRLRFTADGDIEPVVITHEGVAPRPIPVQRAG